MEARDRTVIELFLGLIFIVFLAMVVLFVLYMPGQKQTGVYTVQPSSPQVTGAVTNIVSNSYNNITNNIIYQTTTQTTGYSYRNVDYDFSNHHSDNNYNDYSDEFLDYSSHGQHTREKNYFNNYKDEFDVYVVNKGYNGGYFKVEFNFCDYYDHCFSRIIQKYVPAKEEVKFVYLDVQSEQYKYYSWEYQVIAPKVD